MIVFFKPKSADERRISDWSTDVCSSDLGTHRLDEGRDTGTQRRAAQRRDRASPRAEALIGFVTSQDVDRLVAVEQRIEDRRIALATINNGERIIVGRTLADDDRARQRQIGRASCRERVCQYG